MIKHYKCPKKRIEPGEKKMRKMMNGVGDSDDKTHYCILTLEMIFFLLLLLQLFKGVFNICLLVVVNMPFLYQIESN